MGPTHDRPHPVGTAGTVDQQGAAWVIRGKICLPGRVGRRAPAPQGIVPFMPSPSSPPEVLPLFRGEFPLDVLRQGAGLCNVHDDTIPATVAASQFAARNDARFTAQPIQHACHRFIHRGIHRLDEVFFQCHREVGSEFVSAHPQLAMVNPVYHFSLSQQALQASSCEPVSACPSRVRLWCRP